MKITRDLIEELRHRAANDGKPASYYSLAATLGVTHGSIKNYRHGGTFDDAVAGRVAKLLNYDYALVLTWMAAERAKSEPARKAWSRAAKALATTAAAIVLACALNSFDIIVPARTAHAENIHYAQLGSLILAAFLLLLGHGRARARATSVVR